MLLVAPICGHFLHRRTIYTVCALFWEHFEPDIRIGIRNRFFGGVGFGFKVFESVGIGPGPESDPALLWACLESPVRSDSNRRWYPI